MAIRRQIDEVPAHREFVNDHATIAEHDLCQFTPEPTAAGFLGWSEAMRLCLLHDA